MECHNNSFLPEAAGVSKSFKMAEEVLRNANLASNAAVNINVVTDYESVLTVLSRDVTGRTNKRQTI